MTVSCGRWLTIEEFAEASDISESEARELISSGGYMTKTRSGRDYVWVDDPESINQSEGEGAGEFGEKETALEKDTAEGVKGEALVSRFSGVQELAHQAERAISIVDRSLGTFLMMHQEVVKEKERLIELSRDGLGDRDRKIEEQDARIAELEQELRDKDQELADLRMLVEILEGRTERMRSAPAVADQIDVSEKATVGDLMEDQLKYLMEDQMVRELLKE